MPSAGNLLALAAAASTASAAFQGFNYGATFGDGTIKTQSDFEAEFRTAANLEGTDGKFTSARLYTMVQGGSQGNPIEAIPAAIKTKTSLLFGLWASAGEETFNQEITALQNTIDQYCDQLDGLVAGISVGSEDLYRVTPTGMKDGLPGAGPDTLVDYIDQVRKTVKGTCLSDAPIGHVDTWTAYVNGSNQALIDACDWLGMDTYPYFEITKPNGIQNGPELFKAALDRTKGAGGGRPVWITETGWPVSGDKANDAVPNTDNARKFWVEVGCPMFGETNVWWYTLQDSAPTSPNPSFGVIGSELTEKPLYDLSCKDADKGSGSTSTKSSDSHPKPTSTGTGPSKSETKSETEPTSADSTSKSEPKPTNGGGGGGGGSSASDSETAAPVSTTTAASSGSGPSTTASAPTTFKPAPVPSISPNSSVPTGGSGNGTATVLPTGGGNGGGNGGGSGGSTSSPTGAPSDIPGGSGAGALNSLGAAAVAIILAVGLL